MKCQAISQHRNWGFWRDLLQFTVIGLQKNFEVIPYLFFKNTASDLTILHYEDCTTFSASSNMIINAWFYTMLLSHLCKWFHMECKCMGKMSNPKSAYNFQHCTSKALRFFYFFSMVQKHCMDLWWILHIIIHKLYFPGHLGLHLRPIFTQMAKQDMSVVGAWNVNCNSLVCFL